MMSHPSAVSPPDDVVLASLQELVASYDKEDYTKVISQCQALLVTVKKRKVLDPTMVSAIQRLQLQAHLQQQEYTKVVELGQEHHRDLSLYAQYRQENYDVVSQQASKETLLEQHLLAQSFFHLNQPNPALRVYQDLLQQSNSRSSSMDDNNGNGADHHHRHQMEVLTNTLAVVTMSVVPYIKSESSQLLVQQAESFLEDHPEEYWDLALNLGTLQILEGESTTKWLEMAKDSCTDPEDQVPIAMNVHWSRHFWQKHQDDEDDSGKSYSAIQGRGGTAAQQAVAQFNQAIFDGKALPSSPHPKWSPLQVRMYWYNRAVQQYHFKQYVECQESCQSLKKAVLGKRKKMDSPSDWWWQSRIDVIMSCVQQQQQQQAKMDVAIKTLQDRLTGLESQPTNATIDHAIAHVRLHLHALQYPNATKEQNMALLKSLPTSIQSQPAVVATLAVLSQSTNGAEKKTIVNPLDQADALFHHGHYAEAATLYEQQLPEPSACDANQLAWQLKRVQALAMSEQHDVVDQLWKTLEPFLDHVDDPMAANGEELENQALPRSSKSHITTTTTLAATAATETQKKKRSKESILRQRAKKREAYLKKLEERGGYNPNAKPDPERWIPKHERSRARRKGHAQNNRSAQGGGSQADAQRLDAAARRAGIVPASTGPSTAGLKVSQGGRKGGRRR